MKKRLPIQRKNSTEWWKFMMGLQNDRKFRVARVWDRWVGRGSRS